MHVNSHHDTTHHNTAQNIMEYHENSTFKYKLKGQITLFMQTDIQTDLRKSVLMYCMYVICIYTCMYTHTFIFKLQYNTIFIENKNLYRK